MQASSAFELGSVASLAIDRDPASSRPEIWTLADGSCEVSGEAGDEPGSGTVTLRFAALEPNASGFMVTAATASLTLQPDDILTLASALAFAAGAILRNRAIA